ncbi:hypothetical protein ACV8TO_23630 [Citrobacter freundii]|uniref:hypothetical protein n=1 Tax=Citrobacter TaxID=544 RepID=UPI000FD8F213|nr:MULTISPECIES: hypothetical protein [Citrobacter]HED4020351.1 hypothetical protein [Escherichia coli]MDN4196365.1 hypothetical protein [Citrobacter freundii]MDN4226861.1 hypothetical protein [Citrobacter freundii]MDN4360708.1 hypothetical protein [Citrobacter portucalensis]MDN4365252.1 hypothetical protein [Citrobacter portucalensis]
MTSDEKTNYSNPEACTPTDQPVLKSGTQPVKSFVQIDPELGKKLNKHLKEFTLTRNQYLSEIKPE